MVKRNINDLSKNERKNVDQVAKVIGSPVQVQSLHANMKGEIIDDSKSILMPNGSKLPTTYAGKKLAKNITLVLTNRTLKAFKGTNWDDLPLEIKTRVDFKDSDFK